MKVGIYLNRLDFHKDININDFFSKEDAKSISSVKKRSEGDFVEVESCFDAVVTANKNIENEYNEAGITVKFSGVEADSVEEATESKKEKGK